MRTWTKVSILYYLILRIKEKGRMQNTLKKKTLTGFHDGKDVTERGTYENSNFQV